MNTEHTTNQLVLIAERNDEFRRTLENCTVTRGVAALGSLVHDVCYAVRHYTEFTEDNDPFGEHDFGSFKIHSLRFFWKIDYYDETESHWCDPLSDDCRRHLTIMLAEEY